MRKSRLLPVNDDDDISIQESSVQFSSIESFVNSDAQSIFKNDKEQIQIFDGQQIVLQRQQTDPMRSIEQQCNLSQTDVDEGIHVNNVVYRPK